MTTIVPIDDKLAIVQLKNSSTTASGIIVEGGNGESLRGKVIAVGPNVKDVKEGDVVLVEWPATIQTKLDGVPFFLIREQHVVAVVEE